MRENTCLFPKKKTPEIHKGLGLFRRLQRPNEKGSLLTKGDERFLPRVNAQILFYIFENATTPNLYLLPLIKNIYAEDPNVEMHCCSYHYEYPLIRSKTRSEGKVLQSLG